MLGGKFIHVNKRSPVDLWKKVEKVSGCPDTSETAEQQLHISETIYENLNMS